MPAAGSVHARQDGTVLCLEIDRVAKRNALDMPMFDALARALATAEAEPSVRALMLCGAGADFCAGHDLQAFEAWPQAAQDPVPRFLHALAAARKPLVVALQGWAVGIGATALLHADWVVAEPGARLKFPFVDMGIAPEAGSSLLLAHAIGSARARQLLLGGGAVGAGQAHAWGLVAELAPAPQLRATALQRARDLAAKPAEALRCTKDWLAADAAVHRRIDEEIEAINQAMARQRRAATGAHTT